ncbi:MAG: hypothetical protein EON85_14770 [Brevundimonas sp.]|nr:MAG: hypothetical protein EON85_14770 [Brevundimonas sp.]
MGSLSAHGKQAKASYPAQLLGVWQGGGNTCRLPGNPDSDVKMEITPGKLVDHEQWNEPLVVVQVSKQPQAWKIKSRLYIDESSYEQYELYVLSGSDKGTLTIIDKSRSMTYARCR